ncbi:MAG: hypothetical protein SF182_23980 [Deltaproteobacteria bacterium]|nr:hypothetical protein [Deltaproteobacteria bacterium]
MTRLRRQLTPLVPTVAAFFALCVLAPRAPFLFHRHAGGEHEHVHADGDLLGALAAALTPSAPHRHDATTDLRPSFERPATQPGGHYHDQPRFQRAVLPAAAFVAVSTPFVALATPFASAAPWRGATAAQSRGPPSPLIA